MNWIDSDLPPPPRDDDERAAIIAKTDERGAPVAYLEITRPRWTQTAKDATRMDINAARALAADWNSYFASKGSLTRCMAMHPDDAKKRRERRGQQ